MLHHKIDEILSQVEHPELIQNLQSIRSGSFSLRSLLHIKNAPPDVCAPELTSSQERSPRIMRSGAQFISRALRQVSALRISLHPKSPPPDFCAPELTSSQERSARCLRSGADFISRALRHMFALRSQLTSRALRQIFALRVDQNVLRSQILRSGSVATVASLPLFFHYWTPLIEASFCRRNTCDTALEPKRSILSSYQNHKVRAHTRHRWHT